jgi:hypothetical protein
MLIKEMFSPYLGYSMFGWITKTGAVKLATPGDAASGNVIFHEDLANRYGIDLDKGAIRFYIKGGELWLEGVYTSDSRKYIFKGVKQIEKLCTDRKNFKHFATKGGSNGTHEEQLIINNYYMDVLFLSSGLSCTVAGTSLSQLLNKLDTKYLSEDASCGGTSAGGVASSTGFGNGFVNGGPGTVSRLTQPKKKRHSLKEEPKADVISDIAKQFANFAKGSK